jgi:hypothetical protein
MGISHGDKDRVIGFAHSIERQHMRLLEGGDGIYLASNLVRGWISGRTPQHLDGDLPHLAAMGGTLGKVDIAYAPGAQAVREAVWPEGGVFAPWHTSLLCYSRPHA